MGRMRVPDPVPGQVINEWTVLEPCDRYRSGQARWLCRCSCGEERKMPKQTIYQQPNCGHARQWTAIQGKRFGRLTILHPIERRSADHARLALFRCDCGGVRVAKINMVKQGNVKSCGCLIPGRLAGKARCPGCGHVFPVTLDGSPTPQFCPDCAPKYAGRNWNVCPVCGKLFAAPPSANTVTCSKECSAIWRRQLREGVPHRWSEEAKARLKAKGQTANLKLGTKAAQKSPIAGRFETNQAAKIWTLIDPSGQEYVVRNLAKWARENAALFGKEPGDKAGSQICHGFAAIHQTLRGVRKTPAMTYFGWTLKDVPRDPN